MKLKLMDQIDTGDLLSVYNTIKDKIGVGYDTFTMRDCKMNSV